MAENEPENWEDEEDDYQKVKDGKEKKKGNEANKNLATKPKWTPTPELFTNNKKNNKQ